MFNIVLFEPDIPGNTGNIIRLVVNSGSQLHLIKPYGFHWDDKRLARSGLDYHAYASVQHHDSFQAFWEACLPKRCFALSTKASKCYAEIDFLAGDCLLFGPESRGLPMEILGDPKIHEMLRIPMVQESRSLNLSNSVGIVLYEALRQSHFSGLIS